MMVSQRANAKTNSAAPAIWTSPPSGLLQRKCACGGSPGVDGVCAECRGKRLRSPSSSLQAKLTINEPGDRYEQEADRVADMVMRMPEENTAYEAAGEPVLAKPFRDEPIHRKISRVIQRQASIDEEEEELVQAKEQPGQTPTVDANLEAYIHSRPGRGQSLDPATRTFMEPRFGHDFGHVRVHTDAVAAESAAAANAQAYTVGRHVVFAAGEYAPQTGAGLRLLAHELTHVLQQRAASTADHARPTGSVALPAGAADAALTREADSAGQGGAARASPVVACSDADTLVQRQGGAGVGVGAPAGAAAPAYSVKTEGCGVAPYNEAGVLAAARLAFDTVRTTGCAKTKSLTQNILSEFNGLTIKCKQGSNKPCGRASRYFSSTVKIFPEALNPGCGPLEDTILHEVIHLTEFAPFGHGAMAEGCVQSCFSRGPGDASKCTYETGFVPVLSFGGGAAFPTEGEPTWHARLYLGLEKQGPILGFVHPSLGIGVGLIGETTTGEPGAVPSGTSTLVSLLGGLRLDPGEPGGVHLSLFGGPALAIGSSGATGLGAEATAALGYRWRWIDVSVGPGVSYDPTRETGLDTSYTLGATLKIGPSVPF